MTAYFGSNATKRRAAPPQAIDLGDQGGRVRHCYDEVATTTAMTTADSIELGLLPVGARVVGLQIGWVAHGSGRTVKIGDAGDDDRYLVSTSVAAAGASASLAATGAGYRNATGAPVAILATIGGGTLAANAAGLTVSLQYVQD
jgi:hypothetical protein